MRRLRSSGYEVELGGNRDTTHASAVTHVNHVNSPLIHATTNVDLSLDHHAALSRRTERAFPAKIVSVIELQVQSQEILEAK